MSLISSLIISTLQDGDADPLCIEYDSFPSRALPTEQSLSDEENSAAAALFESDDGDAVLLNRSELPSLLASGMSIALAVAKRVCRAVCKQRMMLADSPVDLDEYLTCAKILKAMKQDKDECESNSLIDKVLCFCYPDLNPKTKELGDFNTRTFMFAMTDSSGSRSYGFCRRVIGVVRQDDDENFSMDNNSNDVLSVCIISSNPWMSFFYQATHVLASLVCSHSTADARRFADKLSQLTCVTPGQTISLRLTDTGEKHAALTRSLNDIDLLPLMSSLDASHVLAMFASVLFDRRVLITSHNMERASLCVLALGDLLRPFEWHHVFIPMLPMKWIDYVNAPMPYICAMHSSAQPYLDRLDTDDIVLVNLDDQSVLFFEDDMELMPPSRLSKLLTVVETAVNSYHKCDVFDNALVKESFVRFFAHIMTGYREFVTLDEADKSHGEAGGTSSIDINAFLASRKGATRRFLTAFSRAQHFEEFIKASHRPEARDELFETLLAEKARNRQKLLRMPEFKSLTLRSKLRREPSAAHAGVAFDEQALITEQQTNSGAATDAADDLLQCDLCERVYSYEADLIIHKLKRHTPPSSDGLFHCTICHARAYADVEDLAFHMKKRHAAYEKRGAVGTVADSERRGTVVSSNTVAASSSSVAATSTTGENDVKPMVAPQVLALLGGRASASSSSLRDSAEISSLSGRANRKLALRAGEQIAVDDDNDDDDDDDDDEDDEADNQQNNDTNNNNNNNNNNNQSTASVNNVSSLATKKMTPLGNKAARPRTMIVPRSAQNLIVLTVDVPAFSMQKKMQFNVEHNISHIIGQITETGIFQQLRKQQQRKRMSSSNSYALFTIQSNGKEKRLEPALLLSETGLRVGDTVRLQESGDGSQLSAAAALLSAGADHVASTAIVNAAATSLAALKDVAKKLKSAQLFDARDKHLQSALHVAAFAGRDDVVAWLLAHKKCPSSYIDARDKNGWSALHAAANSKHAACVAALLERRANPDLANNQQTTPLHYAVRADELHDQLDRMILQGSRVDARDYHGDTPIFQACSRGATRNVELLLEKGAAIDVANDLDERCLHHAVRGGHVDTVALLLKRGASVSVRDKSGKTPRDEAERIGNAQLVALFSARQTGSGSRVTPALPPKPQLDDAQLSLSPSTPSREPSATVWDRTRLTPRSTGAHSAAGGADNVSAPRISLATSRASARSNTMAGWNAATAASSSKNVSAATTWVPSSSADLVDKMQSSTSSAATTTTTTNTQSSLLAARAAALPVARTPTTTSNTTALPRRGGAALNQSGSNMYGTLPVATNSSPTTPNNNTATTTTTTTATTTATASTPSLNDSGSRNQYQAFDASLRRRSTIDLNVVVGVQATSARVALSLAPADLIGECLTSARSACAQALAAKSVTESQVHLYKCRANGTFVKLPATRKLAAAALRRGDSIYLLTDEEGKQTTTTTTTKITTTTTTTTTPPSDNQTTKSPKNNINNNENSDNVNNNTNNSNNDNNSLQDAAAATTATTPTTPRATPPRPSRPVGAAPPQFATIQRVATKIDRSLVSPRSAVAAPSGSKQARILKKVAINRPLSDVWRLFGDFFNLTWTAIENTLREDAVDESKYVGIGGAPAKLMSESMARGQSAAQQTTSSGVVGSTRAFQHSGSTRTIRHRCVGYRPYDSASAAPLCGYAYEMLVEKALVTRLPVTLYASELRARPSASGDSNVTTVEWLATIVVVDDSIVAAVSEEYEKSLEQLKQACERM